MAAARTNLRAKPRGDRAKHLRKNQGGERNVHDKPAQDAGGFRRQIATASHGPADKNHQEHRGDFHQDDLASQPCALLKRSTLGNPAAEVKTRDAERSRRWRL